MISLTILIITSLNSEFREALDVMKKAILATDLAMFFPNKVGMLEMTKTMTKNGQIRTIPNFHSSLKQGEASKYCEGKFI